jgi:hypothetical protein
MTAMTKTTVGLNALRDGNAGVANIEAFYIALGDNDTAPDPSDTKLKNERFRKRITTKANGGTGNITEQIYIEPTEATGFTTKEVGIFIGDSATSVSNSGILFARGLYSPAHAKTGAENMVIPVSITYS